MAWLENTLGYQGAPAPDPFAYLQQQQAQQANPYALFQQQGMVPPQAAPPPPPPAAPALQLQQQQPIQLDNAADALKASRDAARASNDFMGGLFQKREQAADLDASDPSGPANIPQAQQQQDSWSLGKGLGGAASGAGTGAMVGSIVPGVGTAAGAIAGGAIGFLGSLL